MRRIILILSQNISAVKKGEGKKVEVTEWFKGAKSLWSQEEKIYQQCCVELSIQSKLHK